MLEGCGWYVSVLVGWIAMVVCVRVPVHGRLCCARTISNNCFLATCVFHFSTLLGGRRREGETERASEGGKGRRREEEEDKEEADGKGWV